MAALFRDHAVRAVPWSLMQKNYNVSVSDRAVPHAFAPLPQLALRSCIESMVVCLLRKRTPHDHFNITPSHLTRHVYSSRSTFISFSPIIILGICILQH